MSSRGQFGGKSWREGKIEKGRERKYKTKFKIPYSNVSFRPGFVIVKPETLVRATSMRRRKISKINIISNAFFLSLVVSCFCFFLSFFFFW